MLRGKSSSLGAQHRSVRFMAAAVVAGTQLWVHLPCTAQFHQCLEIPKVKIFQPISWLQAHSTRWVVPKGAVREDQCYKKATPVIFEILSWLGKSSVNGEKQALHPFAKKARSSQSPKGAVNFALAGGKVMDSSWNSEKAAARISQNGLNNGKLCLIKPVCLLWENIWSYR